MLVLLSPAKNLDFETQPQTQEATQARMLDQSQALIEVCKTLAPQDLAQLMKLSDKLAVLNANRFSEWSLPFTQDNAKQAILAFNGDVYTGLDAPSLDEAGLALAQQKIRILSGLYGLLKPLDLIQAYRLEMGTKLANPQGKDLYQFWGTSITDVLNQDLAHSGSDEVVNLASNEYFKAVKKNQLKGRLITPVFKDWKNGQYKIISFYAKKARGLMARYAIDKQVEQAEQLKQFDYAGYAYSAADSSEDTWVFNRKEA